MKKRSTNFNPIIIDKLKEFETDNDFMVTLSFEKNLNDMEYLKKAYNKYSGFKVLEANYNILADNFQKNYHKILKNLEQKEKLPFIYSYGRTIPLMARLINFYHVNEFLNNLPFKANISDKLLKPIISYGSFPNFHVSRSTHGWFAPSTKSNCIINYIINKGYSSFYHEYTHYLDFTLGVYIADEQSKDFTYLSGKNRGELSAVVEKIINHYLNSKSFERFNKKILSKLSPARIKYYTSKEEIFARCGSSFFRDCDANFFNLRTNLYRDDEFSNDKDKEKNHKLFLELVNIIKKQIK